MKYWLTALLVSASVAASAQDDITFEPRELADGLTMLQGKGGFAGGNILLSTGSDGTVMIDDSMPPLLPQLKDTIADVAGTDIAFLLNTHLHDDHTGNNASFAEAGAHIVAHEHVRKRLKANDDKSAAALPVITFNDEITFYLNDRPARVIHLPHAHTDGDAAIHFPEANLIHTGDVLFNGLYPFIDLDNGGSVKGYIKAQKRVLEMTDENTTIVPGHGPLASRADLERAHTMLVTIRDRVAKLIAQGKTEAEILEANPLADYHDDWSWGFINTEKMTRTLYRDMATHRHGDDTHSH